MVTTAGLTWIGSGFGTTTGGKQHRFGVVTVLDRSRAAPGSVLVTSINDPEITLVARDGSARHRWTVENGVATVAKLQSDGSVIFLASTPQGWPEKPGGGGGMGLKRISWDGDPVWFLEDDNLHHDFAVLPDGTIAGLRWSPLPEEIEARVEGGIPNTLFAGKMYGDQIVEIDPESGSERVVFDAATSLVPEEHPLPIWASRAEWTHANSIQYLAEDPFRHQEAYLISFREISTIAIVSRASGEVIWSYGGLWELNEQHDPSYLPNGNVLVFDNGQYLRNAPSASQVLEIDPDTNEVVWSYPERRSPFSELYSSIVSGAQRLPNGNTLITYGVPGRLIEVTPNREVVWDYELPDERSAFKIRSYPADLIASLLDKAN